MTELLTRLTAVATVSLVVLLIGSSLLTFGGMSARATQPATNPCVGTITQPPSATTLISIQGARGGDKTASLLVGVHPNGSVVGIHDASAAGRWWAYDIDPLPNGDLLFASTEPGISLLERIDPVSGEIDSVDRLRNVEDAHDIDYLGDGEYVTVDKGDERNRVIVYNRTRGEIVWEWRFDEYPELFPRDGGGPYGDDWTHVNDVDEIADGVFMVSVRNFDQVIAIDRETKSVRWTLGADDDHDTLFEQHNPDYLVGANGTATVLVADSRNDRVVEYAREDGEWTRTWVLEGGGLDEPRDADRLPNGHTLVTDRRGHRVMEVTPRGEVVWEFYTPWQPYDAERVGTEPGSEGPTMRQLQAERRHQLHGSAGYDTDRIEACYEFLGRWDGGSQLVRADEQLGVSSPGMAEDAENGTSPSNVIEPTTVGPADGLPSNVPGSITIGLVVGVIIVGLIGGYLWIRRE